MVYRIATSNNTLAQGYTGPESTIPVPSAADQVSNYLKSKPSAQQLKETLFMILIGLNDAFFAPGVDAGLVVDNVKSMIAKLDQAGASVSFFAKHQSLPTYPSLYSNLSYQRFRMHQSCLSITMAHRQM